MWISEEVINFDKVIQDMILYYWFHQFTDNTG